MTFHFQQLPNTSFSQITPGLQLAIDSTSLGEFKICPRRYFLGVILGFQPRLESVHLTFGILLHSSHERYFHAIATGSSHEDALRTTIRWLLSATWNKDLQRGWQSDHKTKNRFTLVRTVVWYLDQFGASDPIETIRLSNGKPAVELSFTFPSGYFSASTGEPISICGHMDRLGTLNGTPYIIDLKSTEYAIDSSWFSKFTPDNQFTIYTLAGQIVYKVPTQGLIVDGVQVQVGFSRFQREFVSRSSFELEEWHSDLGYWLSQMEQCAVSDRWPKNDKVCNLYGGCQFRSVCSAKSQQSSNEILSGAFKRRVWDPLQRRGDI